ncbi:MAG: hypothetical protein GWN07_19150, partial [Actinobacteria bacterium]|nr:hypothetical protein [Actinomycetota bacterium]NIS32549.1 hypothetical protein [Actinomycetota bacterium]NIU67567.1 hypothetical protein [Actinomycetota bacterium]NIW29326.1 hypothetical protein [Actinomycetota bacterium]NIX21837.1 hypothetical protein [Actinomycetota bacterium]
VYRIDADLGRLQRWWLLAAAVIAALVLRLLDVAGTHVLRRYRFLFLGGALVLLLLPLLPASLPIRGVIVNGARLWVRVDIGSATLSFQPGEGAKLLVVV